MTQPQTAPKSDSTVQVLVTVTDNNGQATPEVVDLDVNLSNPSLQESVIWEEELGEDGFKQVSSGHLRIDTPKKLRVFLYARLKQRYPDLKITDFDLDYDSLSSVLP